ncbi:MAG: hypothetical protein JW915_21290 [Chitinispirillaceae bacterium]|nr:hypothetical protein [Chitinispirillaceae bacterium]
MQSTYLTISKKVSLSIEIINYLTGALKIDILRSWLNEYVRKDSVYINGQYI